MAGPEPESPGHGEDRDKPRPRERSTFSIEDGPALDDGLDTEQGYEAPDQTVFDLTMDYSDDETLLDWEQYAGQRKFYFLGMDCSLVARFCPFMPCVPREWYHRYSKTQRKLMTIRASAFAGLLVLLIGATVLLSLLPSQDADVKGLSQCSWNSYHLPSNVVPSQYNLDLDVQLQSPYQVKGQVEIMVDVREKSNCIVLHALGMTITQAKRLDTGEAGTWSFNDQEQVILNFPQDFSTPSLAVSLEFLYPLKQGLSGFYMSNYTDDAGNSQVMATTQMEANSARKAFPCFDEPTMKAKWNVSITADSDQTVLFNMPSVSSNPMGNSRTRHDFQTTPPMSSYLVAFIVGKLERVFRTVPYPDGKGNDREVSIYGTPQRKASLQPALEIAAKVLPEYERLFGVPYALPKLDLVAIPDFAAGAMENWGLITYRETDLLLKSGDSSVQNERRVALVIAHEMAHLWFGDLVTMKDWGELWLNEGFATYFENIGGTVARPDMAYLETFYSGLATTALSRDALAKSTHPLATLTGMDTAEKVESMFDAISYDKGGAVLRMLRAYLNRDADPQPLLRRSMLQAPSTDQFMASLQAYLQKHQYNSTTSNDLWKEFDNTIGLDVTGWMESWTFQSGYPRVQILLEGNQVKIYQRPFSISPGPDGGRICDGSKAGKAAGNSPWWIPIARSTKDNFVPTWSTLSTCVMDNPVYTLKDDDDWIKLNAGQFGMYRVNYPVKLWDKLANAAAIQAQGQAAPSIPAVDLAGLLDDSWALSQAKEIAIVHFLNLLKSLGRRQLAEYAPWSVAAVHLYKIATSLEQAENNACAEKWSAFVVKNLTGPFMADKPQLGLLFSPSAGAQPDVQARLLRTLLAGISANFNVTTGLTESLTLFDAANANYSAIDPDIRGTVYSYVAASGQQANYDAVKRIYLDATEPNERSRALAALAYAESEDLTAQTLEFALSRDVRSQDTTSLITRVAYRGATSLSAAWKFVRERYIDIANKLGGEKEAADKMGDLLSAIAGEFASERAITELHSVFQQRKRYLTEPRLKDEAEESIRANMDWLAVNARPLCDWLK